MKYNMIQAVEDFFKILTGLCVLIIGSISFCLIGLGVFIMATWPIWIVVLLSIIAVILL